MDNVRDTYNLRINTKLSTGISLISCINEPLPCIISLSVDNLSEKAIKDLTLSISFSPAFGFSHSIKFNYIGPKTTSLVSPNELKKIELDRTFFASVNEIKEGTIKIEASVPDSIEPIAREELPIRLLPYNTFPETAEDKFSLIPAFVLPSMPSVKKLSIQAGDRLRGNNQGTACGYQDDREGVIYQCKAVFESVQALQFEYIESLVSSENRKIRIPDVLYKEKKGTSLDFAIFICSVLENIGLHSVICLSGDLSLVGVFLEEDIFLANSVEDSYSHIQSLVQQEKMLLVDVFALSNPIMSFDEAVKKTKEIKLKNDAPFHAIDISICRDSGIFPLPISYDLSDDSISISEEDRTTRTHANDTFDKMIEPRESVASGFDIWERELLDLSMNNPLLNFKIKRSVSFLCNDVSQFSRAMKVDDKYTITQKPVTMTGEIDPLVISTDGRYDNLSEGAIRNKKLVATEGETSLLERLKRIYRKFRDNLNETGSNTLYLAAGLLKYYEVVHQDNLGVYRLAPIVLIPIDIVRDVKGKSYYIRLRDDDWLLNTTLIEFLKKERGLDFSSVDNIRPDQFGRYEVEVILKRFSKAISEIDGWYCYKNYLGMGSFDFTHYCMWTDIRSRKNQMERNPIVKSLATGRKEWSDSHSTKTIKEIDCFIPLVADSSQVEAITKSADGKSFILFGPPGTGKSQTIVNMICNALFHGKKVLFVSEKQAALDVVYNRLKRIGVDPFCLQLHSSKASKAMVLRQFQDALKHAQLGSPKDYQRVKDELEEMKTRIEYDLEIFNKKSPCFISINDALIGYEDVKEYKKIPSYEDSFIREMNEEKFKRINDITERIAYLEEYGHFGEYHNNDLTPLRGHSYGIEKREKVGVAIDSLYKKSIQVSARINKIKEVFRPNFSLTRANVLIMKAFLKSYLVSDAPALLSSSLVDSTIYDYKQDIENFLAKLSQYQSRKEEKIKPYLEPKILDDKNLDNIYSEVKSIQLSGKLFAKSKSAKKAKKAFKDYLKGKVKTKDCLSLLSECMDLKKMRDELSPYLPLIRNVFREEFKDVDESSYDILKKEYDYASSLYEPLLNIEETGKRKTMMSNLLSLARMISPTNVNVLNVFLNMFEDLYIEADEYKRNLDLDIDYLADKYEFYSSLPNALLKMKEKLIFATEWANMNSALDELRSLGLESSCQALFDGLVKTKDFGKAINCNIYLGTAILSIRENNLENFSGLSENEAISKYNNEIKKFRELSIAELLNRLSANIPSENFNASPTSELGFLKKAIASNGHGKSIRKILDGAINLIRTLCPCFLMSPMSAATYLEKDMAPFDIVIFDEASQIPTAEAVGPISRGKSLVVCGDSNQLPPTSFFKKDMTSENSDFLTSSMPSILEECKAIMLPEQELRWHYRSRSESLIAFSNHGFYYDSLYTFPSIDDQISMVKYCYVDSSYDRSRSRTNEEEAKAIIQEVIKRKKDPLRRNDSIGIVAFSQAQKDLIEDKLDDLLPSEIKDKEEESLEPLFVKNLENVQGDERDVIIFSIGYGMDRNRRMTFNFGPINGINGFRRLNVAISRARKEMLVYTNIDPDKYHDEDIDNPGAQYLFRFLRYAKHGRSALSSSTRTKERKEEKIAQSIAEELRKKGYEVHTTVGDSAFHLNLALIDKEHPEDYLLGVMIEGEKGTDYNLTDKVEIQPQVLSSLGWETMRIYGIDWLNSPASVITNIEINYQKALKNKRGISYRAIYQNDKKENVVVPSKPVLEENKKKSKAVPYINYNYTILTPKDMKKITILDKMEVVIQNEYPISASMLQKRIKKIFNLSSLAGKNKEEYDKAYNDALLKFKTTKNQDGTTFFWKNDGEEPSKLSFYRKRTSTSDRNIEDICKEEMAVAIYDILLDQFALDEEGLSRQLLSYFSVARDTGKYKNNLTEAISYAKENRKDFLETGENGSFVLKK